MPDFRDFDRRFAQAQRRARIVQGVALAWTVVVAFGLFGAAAILITTVIRLGPDGIAREAGRLMGIAAAGYESERRQP